ncbi:unnamed protein product [Caenorhabditis auriculariae]|uniref:Exocyst complex component 2 n=1 Tax=Caenorhabditis auriculariae TaxID=2777116 RepID=A0A8S1H2V7_9PELO|nr:unnamed protein product [Caenorhabditis auriculariae]
MKFLKRLKKIISGEKKKKGEKSVQKEECETTTKEETMEFGSEAEANSSKAGGPPTVTGLSPNEGSPGTQVTIRGENLGIDQNDILMLFICGTDCLPTARWKSSSKIVARIGQASRGLGDVRIMTKSGGRGVSHVKFRVFIPQIGPLEESAVWVDESRTVPGREAIRSVAQIADDRDALGLLPNGRKIETSVLMRDFPDASGNLRMENFSPQWYLLENHADATIGDLREAIKNMELAKKNDAKRSEEMHKANLYALISCVDTLAQLHTELERGVKAGDFAVMNQIGKLAESVFADVLTRKDQADATRNALGIIMRFKFIFFLSHTIDENMKKGEYVTILNDYTRAKSLYGNTEVPLFKEVMEEEQSKLIKYLKILDPESDPTWECITSYYVWLEKVLWDMQRDYSVKALVKEQDKKMNQQSQSDRFGLVETNERQEFVTSLVTLLLNKLPAFWKLANTYHSQDERWTQRLEDINQMLTNVINVSSWLILNALVPKALPDNVSKQYGDEFARWPEISANVGRGNLVQSLKTTRSLISSLSEHQFTVAHVQPLVELCMTVRLKLISDVIDRGVEGVVYLAQKVNWKQDIVGAQHTKTALPDFFENEVCNCISGVREALSTTGYPGEACLFSRERFRETLIELFVHLVFSIKACFDRLFNLQRQRPQELGLNGTSVPKKPVITTKKLLVGIGDVEFIIAKTLNNISKRMTECGVRYVDQIQERSRAKLSLFRSKMVADCIAMMCSAFDPLISSATYEYPPDDDVSDYTKEMIMCCVLQQAELQLYAPQLNSECLQATVTYAIEQLLRRLASLNVVASTTTSPFVVTQIVIDVTALEEALGAFANLEIRAQINAYRASLVGRFDQEKLQKCMQMMRTTMRMALESLEQAAINAAEGYKIGNRRRIIAVLRLETMMTLLNILVYSELMEWFEESLKTATKFERRGIQNRT